MTHNAFIFPYTLQYVGKIPYVYELKNIFFWGQGPVLAIICFIGTFFVTIQTIQKKKEGKWAKEFILLTFFYLYFLAIGKFAVGWIRYMLPLYPLLCLFGAVFIARISQSKSFTLRYLLYPCFLLMLLWTVTFIHIYTKPNTRVTATEWIHRNIPAGSTLSIEHWDDSLPLFGQEKYRMQTL